MPELLVSYTNPEILSKVKERISVFWATQEFPLIIYPEGQKYLQSPNTL
jgi:hypothetical protein